MAWDDLAGSLATLKGRIIVFLDACHSGAAGESATNDDAAETLIRRNNAITVVSASKGRQFSQERPATGGGVFTMNLAELVTHRSRRSGQAFYSAGSSICEASIPSGERENIFSRCAVDDHRKAGQSAQERRLIDVTSRHTRH